MLDNGYKVISKASLYMTPLRTKLRGTDPQWSGKYMH